MVLQKYIIGCNISPFLLIDYNYILHIWCHKDYFQVKKLSEGPYTITQVHTNDTARIQLGAISERLHIRRLRPSVEW